MPPQVDRLEQRQIISLLPNPGDIFSDLTAGVGDITSDIGGGISSLFDPPATSADTVTTTSSASDSFSTNLSSILPSSSVPTSTDVPSSTPSLTPTPSSITPIAQSTVTNVLTQTAVLPSQSSTAPKGFLANKALSGFVFALTGLFALIIIFSIATFVMRRRQRKRLVQEAISFEPAASRMYLDEMDREDNRWNEKNSGDYGAGYPAGHLQYQAPVPPPPRMLYAPPSQLAYANPVGAHDGVSSNGHSRTLSEGSSGHSGTFRKATPALPDSFGDGNDIPPPPPLKIANT